jgi:hypothetical protein
VELCVYFEANPNLIDNLKKHIKMFIIMQFMIKNIKQIDIEGGELKCLMSLDLDKYKPKNYK